MARIFAGFSRIPSYPFVSLYISLSSLQSCLFFTVKKTNKLPPRRLANVTAVFARASPTEENVVASESVAILCVPDSVAVFLVLHHLFTSIKRRHFEQVQVVVSIILNVLKAVTLDSDDADDAEP
ncbi:hypothetical protein Ahy_A01g002947 isoform A [Arachis hypogaea]|uniref:Uncharacterized protein n=1 Tax=Arachis hypogaea TaxID=3818 RepID=A0A445ES52_ARAHY|nr:hypothetical protein Ahy_A01g002947 isoform A [Arachis hypogaea]